MRIRNVKVSAFGVKNLPTSAFLYIILILYMCYFVFVWLDLGIWELCVDGIHHNRMFIALDQPFPA